MYHTKKSKWYFGIKAHIGFDADSGVVHVHCTAANVADVPQAYTLLHGQEEMVCGNSGYTEAEKREELHDISA